MEIVLKVIVIIVFFVLLIISHEFGHFMVGKACGMGITEFSVGFGPKLFQKRGKKDGILYSLRALPLGGYVKFIDDEDGEENNPKAFNNMPAWKRLLTLLAGPLTNIVFARIIAICFLAIFGDSVPAVNTIDRDVPAYESELQEGDQIVSINGHRFDFYSEFSMADISSIVNENNERVVIEVLRDGTPHVYDIETVNSDNGGRRIGITIGIKGKQFGFFESVALSVKWTYLIVAETVSAYANLFTGKTDIKNVTGIVGSVKIVSDYIGYGPNVVMRLFSMFSISIAIFNLIPFPALDGGKIFLLGVEKVIGKRLNKTVEAIINLVGFVILIILAVLLIFKDAFSIWG